jgi:hypothetical protein
VVDGEFRALSADELIAPESNEIAMPRESLLLRHAGRTVTTTSRRASAVVWMIQEATQATG